MMASKNSPMTLVVYCTMFLFLYLFEQHGQYSGLAVNAAAHVNSNLSDCVTVGSNQNQLNCLAYIPTADGIGYCEVASQIEPASPCDFQPCKYGGLCIPDIDLKNFKCNCSYPSSGPTCEELSCEGCYRDEDYVLFVNLTTSMDWPSAYEYCRSRQLFMFMDKDWTKHGFAYGLFSELVPDRDAKVTFWLGLNRTSKDAPWMFVDGTLLAALPNNYSNWGISRPENELCVEMANTEHYLFRWDDDPCESSTGWDYYPVCEMTYPLFLL